MIENENGQSEIAAISLLVNEKKIYPCAGFLKFLKQITPILVIT